MNYLNPQYDMNGVQIKREFSCSRESRILRNISISLSLALSNKKIIYYVTIKNIKIGILVFINYKVSGLLFAAKN